MASIPTNLMAQKMLFSFFLVAFLQLRQPITKMFIWCLFKSEGKAATREAKKIIHERKWQLLRKKKRQ
jgi:hypothetical protein